MSVQLNGHSTLALATHPRNIHRSGQENRANTTLVFTWIFLLFFRQTAAEPPERPPGVSGYVPLPPPRASGDAAAMTK
jgi:hypothetical protein